MWVVIAVLAFLWLRTQQPGGVPLVDGSGGGGAFPGGGVFNPPMLPPVRPGPVLLGGPFGGPVITPPFRRPVWSPLLGSPFSTTVHTFSIGGGGGGVGGGGGRVSLR